MESSEKGSTTDATTKSRPGAKVLLRVSEVKGMKNYVVGDCHVVMTKGDEKFTSKPTRMKANKLELNAEGLYKVTDPTTEAIQVDVIDMRTTQGRVTIPLSDVYEGRTERWHAVRVPKKSLEQGAACPEMRVVIKAYGFGQQTISSRADAADIVSLPSLPPIGVTELDLLLFPRVFASNKVRMPNEPQFWAEIKALIASSPRMTSGPPVVKAQISPSEHIAVNFQFLMAFQQRWSLARNHELTIFNISTRQAQHCCVGADFWSTLVSIIQLKRLAEKDVTQFRIGEIVAYNQYPDRRTQDPPKRGRVAHANERDNGIVYTIELGGGVRERHVKPASLRLWKHRLNIIVTCSKYPKDPVWLSKRDWLEVIEEWSQINNVADSPPAALPLEAKPPADSLQPNDKLPLASLILSCRVKDKQTRGTGS
ncbi:hypothetical protein DIPPA_25044 [Diplonema papillatum]|nr:hypothetical protein DIPPA_25044 [Diplonema papillatum]